MKKAKEDWIKETQAFQRIAGKPEESIEVLAKAYDDIKKKRPK